MSSVLRRSGILLLLPDGQRCPSCPHGHPSHDSDHPSVPLARHEPARGDNDERRRQKDPVTGNQTSEQVSTGGSSPLARRLITPQTRQTAQTARNAWILCCNSSTAHNTSNSVIMRTTLARASATEGTLPSRADGPRGLERSPPTSQSIRGQAAPAGVTTSIRQPCICLPSRIHDSGHRCRTRLFDMPAISGSPRRPHRL